MVFKSLREKVLSKLPILGEDNDVQPAAPRTINPNSSKYLLYDVPRHAVVDYMWAGFKDGLNGVNESENPEAGTTEELAEQDHDSYDGSLLPYEYFALPIKQSDKFIRLLELLPGNPTDDIRCKLYLHHLNSDTHYEALSYVWGNDKDTLRIDVDSQSLNVTRNLRSAFRHLRYTDTSRVLWVDAVCIDQKNVAERTQQVCMMRNIYQSASRTVVWLGTATKYTGKAFSLFAELAEKKHAQSIHPAQAGRLVSTKTQGSTVAPLEKLVVGLESGVSDIVKRPWFDRVWVVQEIALARSATVVCGWNEMSWESFALGVQTGLDYNYFHTNSFGVLDVDSFYNFRAVATIQKREIISPPAEQLLELLIQFRTRHSTDPRDKVFSLLGLVEHIESIGLAPDYASPTTNVYKKTTAALLKQTGNLDILGLCSTRQRSTLNDDMPSWVGDWSNSSSIAKPFRTNALNQFCTVSASRNSTANPIIDDQNTVLVLEGHFVDRITSVGDVLTNVQDENWMAKIEEEENDSTGAWHGAGKAASYIYSELSRLTEHFEIFIRWEKFAAVDQGYGSRTYPTGEDHMAVYWQTLCAGCMPGGFTATEALFKEWYNSMNGIRQLQRFKVNSLPGLYKPLGFAGYLRETWNQYSKFGELMMHATYRRLARTERGYLCMVPVTTQAEDSVVLCKGGKVPLILRPDHDFWQLLGESYVHGLMDGEAFDERACISIVLT